MLSAEWAHVLGVKCSGESEEGAQHPASRAIQFNTHNSTFIIPERVSDSRSARLRANGDVEAGLPGRLFADGDRGAIETRRPAGRIHPECNVTSAGHDGAALASDETVVGGVPRHSHRKSGLGSDDVHRETHELPGEEARRFASHPSLRKPARTAGNRPGDARAGSRGGFATAVAAALAMELFAVEVPWKSLPFIAPGSRTPISWNQGFRYAQLP